MHTGRSSAEFGILGEIIGEGRTELRRQNMGWSS